jgi:hypothetical protein
VSDGEALLVGSDSDIYQYSKSELGIYEYIQKIKNMLFVKKIDNEVYIQTSDNMLYRNSKYNIVYKDATYHNGYEHNSFYIKKLGIAPFDYCSKALENKNIQKKDYIEILKPDFMSYFGELVSILPNFISMQIIENLEKINISSLSTVPSETQKNILNTIKKEIQDKVVSLLRQVMAETFSINIDQEEEFAEELYNRLILPGRNNITQEFYGLAFSTIGDMIQETFNIFNGLDIYGLVIAYYNRHKAELADDMIKEVNKRFVSLEEYKFALDTVRGTEMNCYSEQNFLLNYYVKEDINTIIDGKTGAITESDKNSLFSILPSKDNILIEEVGNYAEWEFQIKDIINTIYKPTQQIYFEDAVKEQDMNPIQWEELPENIDKDEFSRLLNIIIEERKNAILVAINLLVGSGAVPCYSCITDESALIEVRNKINGILLLMKSSAQKKIKKSTLYENVPTSFTVYDSFGAYLYLPKVLERQSKLYAKYLGQLIDIIINEDEELV